MPQPCAEAVARGLREYADTQADRVRAAASVIKKMSANMSPEERAAYMKPLTDELPQVAQRFVKAFQRKEIMNNPEVQQALRKVFALFAAFHQEK